MSAVLTVDASWSGQTGIGRFAQEVISRRPEIVEVVGLRLGRPNASPLSPLLLAVEFARHSRGHTFWSPGFMPPLLPNTIWQSITMHDLTHLHFYGAPQVAYYKTVIRPLVRRMDKIFTVSEYSRREIIDWAGVNAERVVAIHHGLSKSYCPSGDQVDLGAPYVFYIGNRRSYKNLPRLLRAFSRSSLAAEGTLLAVSGSEDSELMSIAQRLHIGPQLRFLGSIPEDRLPATYRGARALAFVSLYEGFGFPVLEAMGCGVPVLTSNVSSLPEVAGGAALLVDPTDVDAIATGLERVVGDEALRTRLVGAGLSRARHFDWNTAAGAYWRAFAAPLGITIPAA